MKNKQVSDILEKFADVLEFHAESAFKINAYRRAARAVLEISEDIESVWKKDQLSTIPGVGKGLQGKIAQYLSKGYISQLDDYLKKSPKELFDLLSIQHFGPKTAALAFNELGVETVSDLHEVVDSGKLETLPGMGKKKVENIRKSLELREQASGRFSIGMALPIAHHVIEYIKEKAGDKIDRISPAGSVRRFCETVHDIDILVETEHGREVIDQITKMPEVTRILGAGETKGSVILKERFQVDIRAIKNESFGAAVQYFTGSKEFNVRLRELARKKGYKISEYGIFQNDTKVGGSREEVIYEKLGLAWIPPEMREDRGEIQAARENKLPELVQIDDIRGDIHMHSTYSDGRESMHAMIEAARKRGYSYIAFCDHSQTTQYANGLSEERLLKQIEEIEQLNGKYPDITILAGSEVEILMDGSLDFSDKMLKKLDFAVASIHSGFKSNVTERTIAAMQNKYVDVIGHPTGRLISRRQPFEIDIEAVVKEAARTGTALEVNSHWDRLDLKDIHIRTAVKAGAKLCINTDAHESESLGQIMFGVGTARRGWAQKSDVINTWPLEKLRQWQKRAH